MVGLSVAAVLASRSSSVVGQPDLPVTVAAAQVADGSTSVARSRSARGGTGYLVRAAVPRTTVSERAPASAPAQPAGQPVAGTAAPEPELRGIETYVVQPGDTVVGLARRFGITPDTIVSANDSLVGNPDLLQLGQELLILPISGIMHEVQPGDTLNTIGQRYQVGIEAIIEYAGNDLPDPNNLRAGQKLVIPGGKWTYITPSPASLAQGVPANVRLPVTGKFIWPTTGVISQLAWAGHMAIDLATSQGTPIYASDGGYVIEAGWSDSGYGQYVLIDHGNGFRSRYAHMSQILVQAGQVVEKGERIGLVGSTGNSTGPHLHFEIYKDGVLQNPISYLP
jgi:murein DD-endopeptidase MepM/ murein hydrolase activator NlpD